MSEIDILWRLVVSKSRVLVSVDVTPTLITNRRGAVVWRVEHRENIWKVKCAGESGDVSGSRAMASIVREAFVLSEVNAVGKGYLVESGEAIGDDWKCVFLICQWLQGLPALSDFRSVNRRDRSDVSRARLGTRIAGAMYAAVAPLHRAGWAHGDIQPDHFLWHDDELALLDFGLAQSPAHPMPGYRGGLVHFNAPEVCRAILARGEAVATPRADVFAVASNAYFAMTRTVLGAYSMDDSWEEKVKVLAQGRFRSDPVEAFQGIPAVLRSLLVDCLDVDPRRRPSSAVAMSAFVEATI